MRLLSCPACPAQDTWIRSAVWRPRGCVLWGADVCGGNALEPMLEREFERPAFCATDVVIFQIGLEHGVAGF